MHCVVFAHISDIELDLVALQGNPHVFLFLFVAAEHPDLREVGMDETLKNGVAKGAGAACNEQKPIFRSIKFSIPFLWSGMRARES